ncbi:hypothetical protein NN561_000260 [Cricetulus griseus]
MRRPRPPPATLACAQAPPRPLPLCGWTAQLQHPRATAGPEFQPGSGRARARAPVHTGVRPPEGQRLRGTRPGGPARRLGAQAGSALLSGCSRCSLVAARAHNGTAATAALGGPATLAGSVSTSTRRPPCRARVRSPASPGRSCHSPSEAEVY